MKPDGILLPSIWLSQRGMSPIWALFLLGAFAWIIYRVAQVFQKPVGDIEELLGQDIPPKPEISLLKVYPTSVVFYWKPPDNYHTPLKNYVHVNGVRVCSMDGSSSSITVSGLTPGHHYGIRAVSTNSSGYTSYSSLMQVQTTPAEGHSANKLLSTPEGNATKRPSTGARRVSAARNEGEKEGAKGGGKAYGENEPEDSVLTLTKRLDDLRREKEQLDTDLADALFSAEVSKADLTKDRDELKKRFEDKEKACLESKRQLAEIEKLAKQAQRKKSKKESDLQEKKKYRQRMKEEVSRWLGDQDKLKQEAEKLYQDKAVAEERQASKTTEFKQKIDDAQAQGRKLEEEIRDWGIKIKALEEERKLADERHEEEEQEAERRFKEDEARVQAELQELEVRYQSTHTLLQAASTRHQQLQNALRDYSRLQMPASNHYAGPAYGGPSSHRGSISQIGAIPSYQATTYATPPPIFAPLHISSPPFPSVLPGLSINNPNPMDDRPSFTRPEVEALTASAQMSPSVDILLPSNLLRDEDSSLLRNEERNNTTRPATRGTTQPTILDGLIPGEGRTHEPQSPSSQHSGAHSFLPSPPDASAGLFSSDEQPNLNFDQALDNLNDAAPRRTFANWMTKRGQKSSMREPPALGTLKQGESQSFPRDLDERSGSLPSHRKQPSNPWAMGNIFGKTAGTTDDLSISSRSPAPRKSRRLFSSSRADTAESFYSLDRNSSSPRPASTYSHDAQLLRPSSESQPFGFSAADHLRLRSSPLGTDWSSIHPGAYSTSHSRRQSIQHGSTSNLSLGSTPLDFDDLIHNNAKPASVAPIGAGRPGKSNKKHKLNPAAQSFSISSMFTRNESRKTPRLDRKSFEFGGGGGSSAPGSSSDKLFRRSMDGGAECAGSSSNPEAVSPSVSRMSRDGYSVMTATTDSHDSVAGDSDAGAAALMQSSSNLSGSMGSVPKESLMQRLTRKGSSSKFSVPWSTSSKDKGSRGKGMEPLTPSEADEGEVSEYSGVGLLGRSVESNTSTPNSGAGDGGLSGSVGKRGSLSWSRVMGKKKAESKKEREGGAAMSETSESQVEEDDR